MLTILIIKFLRLPLKTRLIAGFSVLFLLILLSLLIIFKLFVFEQLSRLPNNDTLIYFHLNLDRQGNLQQIKIVEQLLNDFDLSDLDRRLLGQELAFICGQENNTYACHLALLTTNQQLLAEYLQAKKIIFQQNKKIFTIGQAGQLPAINKSRNPLSYLNYQSGIPAQPITLTVKRPQKFTSAEEKLLSFLPSDFKLTGTTENNQLVLGTKKLFDLQKINSQDLDFILKITPDQSLTEKKWLGQNTLGMIMDQSYGEIFLAGKKVKDTGDLINDYQLFFSATKQPTENIVALWKDTYAQLAGALLPAEKSVYLNDNTRVKLLMPNSDPAFETEREINKIKTSEHQTLFYGRENNQFIAGNDQNFQPSAQDYESEFLFLRIASLSDSNLLKKYFSNYSFIILSGDSLLLE